MSARRLLTALLLVPTLGTLAACDLGGPRIEGTGAGRTELPDDRDDRFSIHSTDEQVKLGLTDEIVYFRLSDEALREADMELAEEEDRQEGLAAVVTSAVVGGVSRALRMRLSFDVDDIHEIRWDDDELVMEFDNSDERLDKIQVNGEELLEKFDEDDVRDFIEAWEEVKADR